METKRTNEASIYFHIGNGGISFAVIQSERLDEPVSKTPLLQVSAHHFGQQTNCMEFSIRPEAINALGEMLIEASKRVTFDGESQVVVQNPRKVMFADHVQELGLVEELTCQTAQSL